MPKSVFEATADYRNMSDRIRMFSQKCLKQEAGKELRSQAIYKRYRDWCAENGFKYENASNFNKKLSQIFVFQSRRPWHEKADKTTMVNNVTWATGEELDEGLAPEFTVIEEVEEHKEVETETETETEAIENVEAN